MLSLMFNAILQVDALLFFFNQPLPLPRQYPFIKINEICLLFCLLGINHHRLQEGVVGLFVERIFLALHLPYFNHNCFERESAGTPPSHPFLGVPLYRQTFAHPRPHGSKALPQQSMAPWLLP